jgi:hypothetical protein
MKPMHQAFRPATKYALLGEVNRLDYEKLTESILQEVLKKLLPDRRKALVLFTGSPAGFEEAVKQVRLLKQDGWDVEVIINRCSEGIFTKEKLISDFEGIQLYFESRYPLDKDLLDGVDIILIPVLTINFAAKMALGIADTPVSALVAYGLINGIPILAVKDACLPENRVRSDRKKSKKPEVYFKMIYGYLSKIEDFGVRMVAVEKLGDEATLTWKICNQNESDNSSILNRRVLTKEDILKAKKSGSFKLSMDRKTIITALAKETADELGVEIVCI